MVKYVYCPANDSEPSVVIDEYRMRVISLSEMFRYIRRPGGWG